MLVTMYYFSLFTQFKYFVFNIVKPSFY